MGLTSEHEDRAEIRDLISEYCFRMDDGNFEGVAALFVEDGEWIANYRQAKGRQQIGDLLLKINPEFGVGPIRKHIVANSVVQLDGNSASSRASYLVLMDRGNGPTPIIVGTYLDNFERHSKDSPWLLRRRELKHEIAGDLSLRL